MKLPATLICVSIAFICDASCSDIANLTTTEKNVLRKLVEIVNKPLSFDSDKVSIECRRASEELMTGLRNFDLWAMTFDDASAKLPSGLLKGNIHQYGNFDECLAADSPNGNFRGHFCLTNIQISVPSHLKQLKFIKETFVLDEMFKSKLDDLAFIVPRSSEIHWALCSPSSCSPHEIEFSVSKALEKVVEGSGIRVEVQVNEEQCSIRSENASDHLDSTSTLVILLFAAFVSFVIALSIYDFLTPERVKYRIVKAFSIAENASILFTTETHDDDIAGAHGIRIFSAILLYLCHKAMVFGFLPLSNREYFKNVVNSNIAYPFRAAYIYTDVFFMLSGFLLSYSMIGRLQRGIRINYWKEIFGRFLRIIPSLGTILIFWTWIFPHLSNGPFWGRILYETEVCKVNGWRNIFLIHNWFGFENICLPHTHHIASDFTLFVVSLFLIDFLYKEPRKGIIVIISLGLVSTIARFCVVYVKEASLFIHHGVDIQSLIDAADYMYFLPPYRFTGYAVGLLLGYVIRKMKGFNLSTLQIIVGEALGWTVFFITVFLLTSNDTFDPMNQALYASVASLTVCLLFSWLLLAPQIGYKHFLMATLEFKYFKVFTSISYSFYLVQFPVFFYNIGIARSSEHGSIYSTFINPSEFMIVLMISVMLTLFVELPFGHLRKIIFESKKKIKSKE